MAEPPKLLGPHAPVTIQRPLTSMHMLPDNLRRLSGVLEEPRIIHDFRAGSHYKVIAEYNIYSNIYTRVKHSGSFTVT